MTRLFKSFRSRLILATIALMIPAVLLPAVFISGMYVSSIQRENEENTIRGFARAELMLDELLIGARAAAASLLSDESVEKYIFSRYEGEPERTLLKRDMIRAVNACFVPYDYLNAVIFFREDGTMYGTSIPWTTFSEDARHPFTETETFRGIQEGAPGSMWLGGLWLDAFVIDSAITPTTPASSRIMIGGAHTLSYLYSGADRRERLTILFSLKERSIRNCFSNLAGMGVVELLDQNGALLSGDDLFSFREVPPYYGEINPEVSQGSFTTTIDGRPHHLIFKRLAMTNWTLVRSIPQGVYLEESDRLRRLSLFTGILTLVIMTALYATWASRFTRPFRRLSAALLRARNGDWSVHMDENTGIYEFRLMSDQFNRMIESTDALIQQNERIVREKMALEMANLQAQINPHFLYNSIASIRWAAEASGAGHVSAMLISLAELMRPIFGEWTTEWPLEQELNLTEHYLALMRLRYIGLIEFEMDAPESLRGIPVPRFILQPLLENCFEHGTSPERIIQVRLTARVQDGFLTIEMEDDGRGIPADLLSEVQSALKDAGYASRIQNRRSIGLYNVHRRVSLYNDAAYGLTVKSNVNQGTIVTVRIKMR